MQVIISGVPLLELQVIFEPSDSVSSVKQKIFDGTGTPCGMQCLGFNRIELVDGRALSSFGISDRAVLVLCRRVGLLGGMENPDDSGRPTRLPASFLQVAGQKRGKPDVLGSSGEPSPVAAGRGDASDSRQAVVDASRRESSGIKPMHAHAGAQLPAVTRSPLKARAAWSADAMTGCGSGTVDTVDPMRATFFGGFPENERAASSSDDISAMPGRSRSGDAPQAALQPGEIMLALRLTAVASTHKRNRKSAGSRLRGEAVLRSAPDSAAVSSAGMAVRCPQVSTPSPL